MSRAGSIAALVAAMLLAPAARALDKQGSAHGGEVGGSANKGFGLTGSASLGASLMNDSYAARPDNTGLALFRYALHVDVDLLGRALSIPIDINSFTDRTRRGAKVFAPSEIDFIGGLTTTHVLTRGLDLELGARFEADMPVDRGSFKQIYADVRGRMLYSLGDVWPAIGRELAGGDLSGYATFGWFAINPTYAARPNNEGLALFRYVNHTELSVWKRHVGVAIDTTFFSDREGSNIARPTELDLTYELIGRLDPFEVHVAYERDMPIGGTYVQSFLYALVSYGFDALPAKRKAAAAPGI